MPGAKTETPASNVGKLYGALQAKTAPAVTGKPVFEKDMEYAKMCGAKSMSQIFGKKLDDMDQKSTSIPLNFGSKESTGLLPDETRLRLLQLKKLVSDVEIQAQMKSGSKNPSKECLKSVPRYQDLTSAMKAFNVTDFDQFIDQVQARFFFEEYELPLMLADQFDQLPMTGPTVRVPGSLGLLEGTMETDDAVFSPQFNTQSSYLVESKNNVVHTLVTQDLLDDSSPAIIDKIRKEVLRGIGRSFERAILDGDDTGAHIDADTQAGPANLFTKAFKGLRQRIFAAEALIGAGSLVYDNLGAVPSKDTFSEILKRLKGQGSDKTDLAYIMGTATSHDLVTGAIPELFTAFAFGGLASNVTGQVPPVFGVKGVESQYVREDLAATGKAIAVPATTLSYLMIVQKSRYASWVRQATRVFASPSLPSSDTMLMTGKARHAFAGTPMDASGKELNAAMAINVKTI